MTTTATADQVTNTILEELAKLCELEASELSREATFEELDIDSLDLVELAQVIEERYGTELQPEDLKGVETLGEAIDAIVGRVATS